MVDFIQVVNQLSPLTEEARMNFLSTLQTKTIQKGDYLLANNTICRYLFFIDSGLAKTFFNKEDKEFIMRFFPERSLFTVLDSFITHTASSYSIVALEETTITYIGQTDLHDLCNKHHSVETFFRKLVSIASINMMKRISEMLEENATERYNNFVKENNHLLQRISLGDLASYIGITQVSLSRIRAQK